MRKMFLEKVILKMSSLREQFGKNVLFEGAILNNLFEHLFLIIWGSNLENVFLEGATKNMHLWGSNFENVFFEGAILEVPSKNIRKIVFRKNMSSLSLGLESSTS